MSRYSKWSKARSERFDRAFHEREQYIKLFDDVHKNCIDGYDHFQFWESLENEIYPLFFSGDEYLGSVVFVSRLVLARVRHRGGDFPVKSEIYPSVQSRYSDNLQVGFENKVYPIPRRLISLHSLTTLACVMAGWGFAEYPGGRYPYKVTPLGEKFFRLTLSSLTSHFVGSRKAQTGGDTPSLLDQQPPKETGSGSGWIARLNPKNWS